MVAVKENNIHTWRVQKKKVGCDQEVVFESRHDN